LPLAERFALARRASDHILGPVAAIGHANRAFLCCLPLELDGQLAGFWQGNHLLDVEEQPVLYTVRDEPDGPDVSAPGRKPL
jgi:hypothetical protein